MQYLDDLINECEQDIDVKIPELGEHYALQWTDSSVAQEQNIANVAKPIKMKAMPYGNDVKKNGLNMIVETFRSPFTQRLLSALLEEKVFKSYPPVIDKLKGIIF